MSDDVVAELESWLKVCGDPGAWSTVLRARDEIVALRTRCALHDDLEFVSKNELTQARDDALEEAARVCELKAIAKAIRALKDKP